MSELGDRLREKLVEASRGQPETFGFVAMFMDMIDEAEKEMELPASPTELGKSK